MGPLIIMVAVLGFIAIAGAGLAFAGNGGPSARTAKRAQAITTQRQSEKLSRGRTAATDPAQRRKQLVKSLKEQDRVQRKASLSLAARLQQAGLSMSVQMFWVISGAIALVILSLGLLFRVSPLIALGAAFVAGLGLPRWVVGFLAKGRAKKFTEYFADSIDIIVRGIKSGLPVHDCLKIIASESPAPLGPEFRHLVENISIGVTIEQGLEKMYQRMPTSELRFFTIVLAIQQKTGGNLAEALANLSAVLRARKLMRAKIKALASEATASAMIIGSLPPVVMILVSVTSPGYMLPLIYDPRGHLMLLAAAMWMSLGIFFMRRMINFKY
jgi:tight adherence protein B